MYSSRSVDLIIIACTPTAIRRQFEILRADIRHDPLFIDSIIGTARIVCAASSM